MRFDDPEVREFLARSMILRLAALSPKGQPNIRCLWFVCQQGRIYIFTGETNPTSRGISVHPHVALLFDGERGPRSSRLLRVRGRAVFRRESGIVARVMLGLARKYFLTRPGLRNLLASARSANPASSSPRSALCAPHLPLDVTRGGELAEPLAKWRCPRLRDSRRRPTHPSLAAPTQFPKQPQSLFRSVNPIPKIISRRQAEMPRVAWRTGRPTARNGRVPLGEQLSSLSSVVR